MNTSTIFKKAHALTKATIQTGDSYSATFAICLKVIYAESKEVSFDQILLNMGLKVWEKGSMKRIYINKAEQFVEFAEKAGLDMAYIECRSAFVNRINSNPTWFDCKTGKFESKKVTVNTLFETLGVA